VDDDGNPDKDKPPEEVECAKCTVYSTADDPAVRDWVKVRVCAMDLDVDSDNNNDLALPDRSRWEEEVEDVVGDDHRPGKVLLVNDVDYDEDGIVDWADGFDLDPLIPDDDVSTNSQFVPVILEVSNIDFANAKIRIHYDASDPSLIDINAVDPSTMLPHLPSGKLRLWRKNGNEPRSKLPLSQGGDFIAPGVYSPPQLGLSPSQPMTVLFVEAVRASDQVADLAILVEIDPTGTKGFILRDQVRLTAVRIEIIGRDLTDGYERLDYGFAISQPDGSDEWQEEVYRVRVYDPRNSIQPKLLISGHTLPLSRVGTYFETPPFLVIPPSESTPVPQNSGDKLFLTLDEGLWVMEYIVDSYSITILGQQLSLFQRIRRNTRGIVMYFLFPRDIQMRDAIQIVVNNLISSNFRPEYYGHFGMEVHNRIKQILSQKDPNWLFDVYVGPDGKILSIGGPPSSSIPSGSVQIDALYLKFGYKLKVGEKFDPDKILDLYEIKTSIEGDVRKDQLTKLITIMKGRDIKIVRSPKIWDWKSGKWIQNPKYHLTGIILKGTSAIMTIQAVWIFVSPSRQNELLGEMEQKIKEILWYEDIKDWYNKRLSELELVSLIRQYFEPISPSNLSNIMWWKIAVKILSDPWVRESLGRGR
jgi:hypothetical protein